MAKLPHFGSVLDVRYGKNPALDAWILHFMTENNLEYVLDPEKNASPEQVRFMVDVAEDQVFAPCSDWMLLMLLSMRMEQDLRREYNRAWKHIVELTRTYVPDRYTRRRIIELCRHKYRLANSSPIIIPSRLLKRLTTIFMTQSGIGDPYRERKKKLNSRAADLVESSIFADLLDACPAQAVSCTKLRDLRFELDLLELRRMLILSTYVDAWEDVNRVPTRAEFLRELESPCANYDDVRAVLAPVTGTGMRILYLPETSGGIIFDLLIIRSLLRQGHSVILALKEGFCQDEPTIWDIENDPALERALLGAHVAYNNRMGKNELLRAVREHRFVVISDGTRERLNLFRASVTFARAWKESDLVIAKGEANYRRLIQTSHSFTRDVLCFFRDEDGGFHLFVKKKSERVKKFTEADLTRKAEAIIADMRRAKAAGQRVMFYSAVVGSIPGQTKTAIELLHVFVGYLRSRLDRTWIVNPAEHFEEGLDADDLMFMWERVQRSGLIDVWRFQSSHDIDKSFELLGRKVSPFWAGKDATFSTGCTKEMHIALDMQKRHPEMQILGPDPEKFFRRREYGVGKFCDVAVGCP